MNTTQLVGTEGVEHAGHAFTRAAERFAEGIAQLEYLLQQRRYWEEECLARIEAIAQGLTKETSLTSARVTTAVDPLVYSSTSYASRLRS
jgi:hypothetical protein